MTRSLTLLDHIAPALLVVFRLGGLMLYAPVFGSAVIPVRMRILLTFVLGAAAYPVLSSQHQFGMGIELELWVLGPLVALEIVVGLLIGFLASLPLMAMQCGGIIISQQMGLGFAQLYNPAFDDESDVVANLLYFMALGTFIVCGGLEATLLALLHSFERVPAGAMVIDAGIPSLICGMMLSALELGLRVAAPLLCIVFLETVALGFLSKTVPQLNILSLGFPLRILVGITILALGATVINDVMIDELDAGAQSITAWIEGQPDLRNPER